MEIPQWEEDYKLSALPDHHMFWEYLEVGKILLFLSCRNQLRFFLVAQGVMLYQTQKAVFGDISKHREESRLYDM